MKISLQDLEEIYREREKASEILRQMLCESIIRRKFTMPIELREAYKINEALNCIKHRWPNHNDTSSDSENPVFILSAGWRSGSTLMQRLVISSGEIAMWGEPLGEAAFIPRLASGLSAMRFKWPLDTYFDNDPNLSSLSNKWIANLTPPISYLRSSHRLLLQRWLGASAREKYGVSRWGFKEVGLTIDHARYLKWLFPNACFIFIYRNLFDAYKSWKGNRWGNVWPGYCTRSPVAFARHWRHLLEGFTAGYKEVDGFLVKFEDLVTDKIDLSEVANHIRVKKFDSSILQKKIGSPTNIKRNRSKRLSFFDRAILSAIGRPMLKELGYRKR